MIDLFFEYEDFNVANYADDTNSCTPDIPSVTLELQVSAAKRIRWFKNNCLKANPGKSLILFSIKKSEIVSMDGFRLLKVLTKNY